ncbi:MAG: hypothetical protein R3C17_13770 [Planctomycetaceae bacterium]
MPEERFRKDGQGKWIVIFERRTKRNRPNVAPSVKSAIAAESTAPLLQPAFAPQNLERELVKRGIGPASAEELSLSHPSNRIQDMLELYDWYNGKGQSRGPGFLVQSIRNPDAIAFPPGFVSSSAKARKMQRQEATKAADEQLRTKRERQAAERDRTRQRAFMAFWESMSPDQQDVFETEALEKAEQMTRRLYLQHSAKRGKAFELYRKVILQSHFLKIHQLAIPETDRT